MYTLNNVIVKIRVYNSNNFQVCGWPEGYAPFFLILSDERYGFYVRYEVLTAVKKSLLVLCGVKPRGLRLHG